LQRTYRRRTIEKVGHPYPTTNAAGKNPAGLEVVTMRSAPLHRSIVAVDIERSTSPVRTNPIREELRREVYRMLGAAMQAAGIGAGHCDPLTDRGDGVLALIRPSDDVPKTLLLNPLVPALARLLADRNASLTGAERSRRQLRLRAVIHAGEVHYDGRGHFGEALDVAFRLLDSPRLKKCLRQVMAPLVLVVSEDIYWSIVRHEYEGISGSGFEPLVGVTVGGRRRRGWVHVPIPHVPMPALASKANAMVAA
jgi:hypothetical protein